jgi:hypothetical protein
VAKDGIVQGDHRLGWRGGGSVTEVDCGCAKVNIEIMKALR